MAGERDLAAILASLSPQLDPVAYGYASLPGADALPRGLVPLGTFREAEGLTVIAAADALQAAGIAAEGPWARITVGLTTSLEAVGLTAALAGALGAAGISANVVAAYHHDHLFVPWARRDEAMAALAALARRGA